MSAPSVARVSSSARGARVGKERYGHPVATAIEASALADSRTSRVSMRSQPFVGRSTYSTSLLDRPRSSFQRPSGRRL